LAAILKSVEMLGQSSLSYIYKPRAQVKNPAGFIADLRKLAERRLYVDTALDPVLSQTQGRMLFSRIGCPTGRIQK
jgi:hypothetical protein